MGEAIVGIGEPGKSPPLNVSPEEERVGEIGANPATGLITLTGWGATGVVDRLYCGVRFGLSLGDELSDLVEYEDSGLVIMLDHGLLFVVVGVARPLVAEDTDEAVGEDGPRLVYHV